MEIKLTPKQKELIEKMGVFSERNGSAPAQARIMALLLICDKTELTFDEIQETLQLSKSAVSNAINSLLLIERIEYHTKPGDRKRYFSSRITQMESDFEKSFAKMLQVKSLLQEVLESRTKETKEFNAKLQSLIDFMDFLQRELPESYKKWRKMKS